MANDKPGKLQTWQMTSKTNQATKTFAVARFLGKDTESRVSNNGYFQS